MTPTARKISPAYRAVLAAVALSCAALPARSADNAIGVDAMIRNSVQVKPAGAAARPAVLREAVHLGDTFFTGAQSSVQVLFRDRTNFTVGANARVTIDRFVYDPSRNSSDVAASVTKGAFRFMSGRPLAGNGRNAVTTPVATIGVRGTIFEGAVGPDVLEILRGQPGLPALGGDLSNATLVVLVGPGPNSQGGDKPGAIDVTTAGRVTLLDHPGLALLVLGDGTVFGPFQLSDEASARLLALLIAPPGPGTGSGPAGPTDSITVMSGDVLKAGKPGSGAAGAGAPGGVDLPPPAEHCIPTPNKPCG